MTLLLRAARLALAAAVLSAAMPACFTAGGGTAPPPDTFYFPTGLAVSTGGNVLYAINSDFDLQWNGGTLQTYDLFQIRQDAATLIAANAIGATSAPAGIPFLDPWQGGCPDEPPPPTNDLSGIGVPVGESCAPPVDSTSYVRDSAIVGAFATDLEVAAIGGSRLFAPVSGNATVTWADVTVDDPTVAPPAGADKNAYPPYAISCNQDSDGRCGSDHETGDDPNSTKNSRNLTMPGEPFGMAQSQDGTVMAVTSETDTKTSLLTTGLPPSNPIADVPTMQFVLDGMPNGGVALAAVPHDPYTYPPPCELVGDAPPCIKPAFLQTNRGSAEVDLLRFYDDDGTCTSAPCTASSPTQYRPYLEKERAYQITTNGGGSDSRGIVIDPSPRIRCEAQYPESDLADREACATQQFARIFIANRTGPTIVVGHLGSPSTANDGTYDPDQVQWIGNVSLTEGPSKLFLAPIVEPDYPGATTGHYALRLFVVCYDSNAVFIYDPDDLDSPTGAEPEMIVYTGAGPYAMAFDPFSFEDAALGKEVPLDPKQDPALGLKQYRFAYVASFTHSYVQMIDLDQASPTETTQPTFESIVFTLGKPVQPKGQ
jgi:hypothetical protein